MYLLYLDESGNPDDPQDRHFVLAGAAVHETQTHWLSTELDRLQAQYFPGLPPITFHATEIRSGKGGFWRSQEKDRRDSLLLDIAQKIKDTRKQVALFAAVVEKNQDVYGEGAIRLALDEICGRFDIFLKRQFHENNDPQRGLLVFSDSSYKKNAKVWVREFKERGTRLGILKNLSDIPYFATPAETRMLQVADFVAHAFFQLYERRNPTLAAPLLSKVDQKDGILHGLVHVSKARGNTCECPRCFSSRAPGRPSPWLVVTYMAATTSFERGP